MDIHILALSVLALLQTGLSAKFLANEKSNKRKYRGQT